MLTHLPSSSLRDFTLVSGINLESILTPSCEETSPGCYNYGYLLSSYWADDNSVRNALQVEKSSGDHDMGVPYVETQAWIRSLNYSIMDDWRPWMINSEGGGHTLDFKPVESFIMFKRWITGRLM
ncbi:unnamed protein product [Eruca vesicaria subsp. sativa]|uniref:Uncharacterized protein n=1 Tax=Eruca vesicaria subsp. sativa TaxID=29727 RepID=A0ABC8JSR1_ERUVS|nr:unnamed protein product [Eruca vesicaria subsp. sativa]